MTRISLDHLRHEANLLGRDFDELEEIVAASIAGGDVYLLVQWPDGFRAALPMGGEMSTIVRGLAVTVH